MYTERQEVTIITDGSGDGVGYTLVVNGRILSIRFVKPGSGGYETTVDFAITGEKTGVGILSVENVTGSKMWFPRDQVSNSADGSGLTYDGSNPVCEPVALANERVKIVVAQGGNTKSGTFHITIG